jgi:hypothetical protein
MPALREKTGRQPDAGMASPRPGDIPAAPSGDTARTVLRSAARKAGHRSRHAARPVIALPLLIAWPAAWHAAGAGGTGAMAGAAAAGLLAVITGAKTASTGQGRAYAMTCGVTAAGWLAAASLAGLSRPLLVTLLATWTVMFAPWWNHHRAGHEHGRPATVAGHPAPPPPLPEPDEMLTRLRDRVCGDGARLAGARITEMPPIPGGRVFRFSLVPGRQTVASVTTASAEIASAAEVPLALVITEAAPGAQPGERGPENLAHVTILAPAHPQQQIQEFTGPTLDMTTGLFSVGPYPDGLMAPARLFKTDEHGQPIRGASGITAGAMGSGKSRFAEHRILEQIASGFYATVLLDGQGGASIPSLTEWVTWPALNMGEWEACLRSMLRLMISRTRFMAARRAAHWNPEWGPFVGISIEEAHRVLLAPANLRAVKTLLQEPEKVGMGVELSTQFPSQIELGASSGTPGANVLRDLAGSGNVDLFRTGGKFAKSVLVGEIEIAPHLLPQQPGWCHPLGPSMRTAPVRAIRVADPAAWAGQFTRTGFAAADVTAMDGADRAFSTRLDRLDEHMAAGERGVAAADVEEHVRLILGESAPGAPAQGQGSVRVLASSALTAVLREQGPLRRRDAINAVRQAGHEYSEDALDQAYAAMRRIGSAPRHGQHGVWQVVQDDTDDETGN